MECCLLPCNSGVLLLRCLICEFYTDRTLGDYAMALSLGELVDLLGIGETQVRRIFRPLPADGRSCYPYPGQPSHPRQRYIAGPESLTRS